MKEPMINLVENAIGASFGPSAELIPVREFNAAVKVAARAALAALRTPTEAMVDAGDQHTGYWSVNDGNQETDSARPCWQAMIDAALAED